MDTVPPTLQLQIVTPDQAAAQEVVEEISIPGREGYLGILPGHAPLLSELKIGELTYKKAGLTHYLSVVWGFAEVLPDRVTILTQAAEPAEEIDLERAQRAQQRAEERLMRVDDPDIDMERARLALERAVTRMQTARRVDR